MIEVVERAEPDVLARFDAVIDVRSPGEFEEDHAPGAINLPVLSNAERAEVGTIYVQQSRFLARRVGAAYIARNVARHLETALADKPGSFRPLIYCWRGGQRSSAMATILSQVGWRTAVLAGGYRTYRRHVSARLYETELPHRFVLLQGPTGSGKTDVLHILARRGAQVLDLEALAAHRGSVFGAVPGKPQPSQKLFESRLLAELEGFDPARAILAEAESSKIGERMIPPAVWRRMEAAPQIELTAPPRARVQYLLHAYGEIAEDPAQLAAILARIPERVGRERVETWRRLAAEGGLDRLAAELVELHYDPAYLRASRQNLRPRLATIDLGRLDLRSLEAAADQVFAVLLDAAERLPGEPVRA